MEQAALTRRAAREAVADVEPPPLRERLEAVIEDASMVPGILVVLSARTPETDATAGTRPARATEDGDGGTNADPNVPPATDAIAERAAGVQLIYEGLRLTRSLAQREPWASRSPVGSTAEDIDILAADVLVSRGFYLLAMTEAADRAVGTVRAFGRDQTLRQDADADPDSLDRELEANVFELAAVAGTTAVGAWPSETLLAGVREVAYEFEGGDASTDGLVDRLADCLDGSAVDAEPAVADDHVPSSATDP